MSSAMKGLAECDPVSMGRVLIVLTALHASAGLAAAPPAQDSQSPGTGSGELGVIPVSALDSAKAEQPATEQASTPAPEALDTVVVTATRTRDSLAKTPISVSVTRDQQLRERGDEFAPFLRYCVCVPFAPYPPFPFPRIAPFPFPP